MNATSIEVLVLDINGDNLGKMSYMDAKLLSDNRDLDLVQVNKKGDDLLVYKIMDYGKWKYQNSKNKKNNKSHSCQTKEIGFKVRTEIHDIETKISQIKKFINKGHDVKISVTMKGREKSHPQIAIDKMANIIKEIETISQVHQEGKSPNSIYCTIRPLGSQNSD